MTPEPDAQLRDDRVWITREKMLETAVEELTAERDFLREMLRAALVTDARALASDESGET